MTDSRNNESDKPNPIGELLAQYAALSPAVSYTLGRLDRLVSQQLGEALQGAGMTLPQFTVLSHLYRRGASANAALAARSFISPQAANQIVNTMLEQGWVRKRSDPNHGRMVLIELTQAGHEVYRQGLAAATVFEQRLLHGLPPENLIMLNATLRHLLDNLRGR